MIRWIVFLQEFDIEIKDKSGAKNKVVNHLSRIPTKEEVIPIEGTFPNEKLFKLHARDPWFANLVNFLATNVLPKNLSKSQID